MSYRIFTLTDTAKDTHMTLDDAVNSGEIKTVETFETYDDALDAFFLQDIVILTHMVLNNQIDNTNLLYA